MNVILYKYYGEHNKVDKSGDLTQVLSLTGSFKADTSILNPSLLLSLPLEGLSYLTDENGNLIADVITLDGTGEVLNFNYMYIAEFRRYYYVSSIVVSSASLLVVTGEVDPLYSFKDEILANDAMIERNEFTYDPLQEDTMIPLEMSKEVTEEEKTGSLVNTTFKADYDASGSPQPYLYTVSVAAAGGSEKTISPISGLPTINTSQAGDVGGQMIYALTRDNVIRLVQGLLGEHSSLATFFKTLTVYPFTIDEKGTTLPIYVYKLSGGTFSPVNVGSAQGALLQSISNYRIVADFTLPSPSMYYDLNPYTHYEVYLPFYGWYEIKYNEVGNHRLLVYYSVNFENGSGEVYLYDYTDERILFNAPCQIGIQLSLSSSNAEELAAQKNAAQLNLILGLVGSGVGLVGSAAHGNVIGAVGAGLSGVQAVTSYINQTSLMFERAQSTHNGPAGSLYAPMKVRLRITKPKVRDNLDFVKFGHQYGRVLRDVRALSGLTGFTQIAKIHLEGCTATDAEKQEIESSLMSGVIL